MGDKQNQPFQLSFNASPLLEAAAPNPAAASTQVGVQRIGMHLYFAFFLASGFCSLVYEVVWLRLAVAEFGVTTPLVSIVLSVFMAGLGLGSWGVGRFVRRFQTSPGSTLLRLYGCTELLIGISALVVPGALAFGHTALVETASGLAWQSTTYYLLAGGWVTLSLVPWCFCMGATFPFAMGAIKNSLGPEAERSFSYLYLANVVGAVLGTIVSAFFLIELFGFRGTLHFASAINGILAASVFVLSFSPALAVRPAAASTVPGQAELSGSRPNSLLAFLFVTGLASMGMEVVWIRQFTPYLGNVVYAFAAILAIYLVATSLGSTLYRWRVRVRGPKEYRFAWVVAGLLALIPLFAADPRLPHYGGVHEFVGGAFRSFIGIFWFSLILGFLTPMLVDRWSSGDPDRAGSAYAVNVLGSILGPLLAGFWLLTWMDERWALLILSAPLFLLGVIADFSGGPAKDARSPQLRFTGYAAVLLLSLGLVFLTRGEETQWPNRVVRRDYTATVVATGEGMDKRLFVNGIGMTVLTPITKMMAHLPLSLLGRPPEKALVVCFGMGTTFRSVLSWGIQGTAVDLVPSVPAVFGYFHADGPELVKSPLAKIVIDDGRRFLEGTTEQYDVITLDPPPPIGAPTSSLLYSREFYAAAKAHLRPDGVMQVWMPGGDAATESSIAQSLQNSFPYVRAFQSMEGWGLHFLASMRPLNIPDGSVLASRLPPAAARDLVEWGPAATPDQQFNIVLGREVPIETLIDRDRQVPAMGDNEPVNEYFFLRRVFKYYR
jgi:spermidine synthase